jgi:hypothetical protein
MQIHTIKIKSDSTLFGASKDNAPELIGLLERLCLELQISPLNVIHAGLVVLAAGDIGRDAR